MLGGAPTARIFLAATLLLSAQVMAGCAGQTSNADLTSPGGRGIVYPINAEEADAVLSQAMVATFPGLPISGVSLPNKGYTATISLLLDSHRITATAIPTFGRGPNGSRVSGHSFEVAHAGTMPVSGSTRAGTLFESINQRAAAIRAPIPALTSN
jgi:hypothetical protein